MAQLRLLFVFILSGLRGKKNASAMSQGRDRKPWASLLRHTAGVTLGEAPAWISLVLLVQCGQSDDEAAREGSQSGLEGNLCKPFH